MNGIDVSIIIPAYNAAQHLQNRYNGIRNAMNKLNCTIEIVFINDGSTDNTVDVATDILRQAESDEIKVKFIHNDINIGTFEAEYSGVWAASGKYVFFQDADDPFNYLLLNELVNLRETISPKVHIAAPAKLLVDGTDSSYGFFTYLGDVKKTIREMIKNSRGMISRRSLFETQQMRIVYRDIRNILTKNNITTINCVQDSIVIVYMFGERIFEYVMETQNHYLYEVGNETNVTKDTDQREKDIPVLRAFCQEALDKLEAT